MGRPIDENPEVSLAASLWKHIKNDETSTMTTIQSFRANIRLTEISFPDYNVRGGVLLGRDLTVIWDTLSHPDDMRPLLPLLAGRKLRIIYSHADWDHIWGTAAFAPETFSVIGHRHCRQRFNEDVPQTLRARQAKEPGIWEAVQLIPPDIIFEDEYHLDLGDLTLQLYTLPGHTPDAIVGFVPEHGLLLAGDTVETPLPCVPPCCPIYKWIDGLQRWLDDPRLHTVIPAHGKIGGKEIIAENISYLRDLATRRQQINLASLPAFYRETHLENLRNIRRIPEKQLLSPSLS